MHGIAIPFIERFRREIKFLRPLAYYPLVDNVSDAEINIAPGHEGSNDATITGATPNQDGQVGPAYSFDGIDDEITHAVTDDFSPTNDISVVVIFKLGADGVDNASSQPLVVAKYWKIHVRTTNNLVQWRFDNAGAVVAAHTLGNGDRNWHIGVGTYDNSDGSNSVMKIYIDGVIRQTTNAAKLASTTYIQSIGKISPVFFNGYIQHVALFDKVLTEDEVLRLAQYADLAD